MIFATIGTQAPLIALLKSSMRSLLCQTNSLLRKHTKEDINLKILKRLIFGT